MVAQVANQLANLFIEENLRAREDQAEGTSEFIALQVADAKKKLDTLETAIREYKSPTTASCRSSRARYRGR